MAGVIEIPKRSITQISAPLISQAIKSEEMDKVLELYRKTSIHQLLAGTYIFLGIWCNIDLVFARIPKGEVYQQGKYVVAFLGLSKLIDMSTGAYAEIMMYSRYYRFSMITMILLAVLTIGTNYLFIPIYGINGAAFAAALSIFLFTVVKVWFLWAKFRIQPFTVQTLYALLMVVVIYLLVRLMPAPGGSIIAMISHIGLRSLLITGLFVGLTLWLRISPEVSALGAAFYRRARTFIRWNRGCCCQYQVEKHPVELKSISFLKTKFP
jgi:O-antigen/teichoic acid export membrane protein